MKVKGDEVMLKVTGAQPGIFRGWTGFWEKGHFNKHFMHGIQKKDSAGKNFLVFSPRIDILKTAFQMRI